jgi:hypothetical protein
MLDNKSLLSKVQRPVGKEVKERLDNWLNENVNVPLSKEGYPDTGAAISAVIGAGGEFLIPDDLAEAAMALVPGAKLLKSGAKGMKALKKAKPGLEKAGTIDFGAIKKAEDITRKKKISKADEAADTLVYKESGEIIRKKPKVDVEEEDIFDSAIKDLKQPKKRR